MIIRVIMKIILFYILLSLDGDMSLYSNVNHMEEWVGVIDAKRVIERTNNHIRA